MKEIPFYKNMTNCCTLVIFLNKGTTSCTNFWFSEQLGASLCRKEEEARPQQALQAFSNHITTKDLFA